jgi:phosphoribosylamine--glycine ligase
MKVLVVGGGGREHAIVWKLSQSSLLDKIYCAPGNPGIANFAESVKFSVDQSEELANFAEKEGIELTVIGPEAPLCSGIADIFRERNLRIFGPGKEASRLEGSKSYAKNFMKKYNIPTAESEVFYKQEKAEDYIKNVFSNGSDGIVVKADGLAAGKGVTVAQTCEEALQAVESCFDGVFGDAGYSVLIEELLKGEEASILAFCDGKNIVPLASSQDHKRLLDGDKGPNTGGMGAYSPAPVVTDKVMEEVKSSILRNFLRGVEIENLDFRGVIYAGIMIGDKGINVLEFNVRFGDPETQAVLMRLESDLAEAMFKTAESDLYDYNFKWSEESAVCVVLASGGYPVKYDKGFSISGIGEAEKSGAVVFHAGTGIKSGKLVNSGGRVLGVSATGEDIETAINNAYHSAEKIKWRDMFYRKDIGFKALN